MSPTHPTTVTPADLAEKAAAHTSHTAFTPPQPGTPALAQPTRKVSQHSTQAIDTEQKTLQQLDTDAATFAASLAPPKAIQAHFIDPALVDASKKRSKHGLQIDITHTAAWQLMRGVNALDVTDIRYNPNHEAYRVTYTLNVTSAVNPDDTATFRSYTVWIRADHFDNTHHKRRVSFNRKFSALPEKIDTAFARAIDADAMAPEIDPHLIAQPWRHHAIREYGGLALEVDIFQIIIKILRKIAHPPAREHNPTGYAQYTKLGQFWFGIDYTSDNIGDVVYAFTKVMGLQAHQPHTAHPTYDRTHLDTVLRTKTYELATNWYILAFTQAHQFPLAPAIVDRVITDDNIFDPPTPEETYRQLHAAHTKTHTS